jgi:uncharacterized protein
MTTLVPTLDPEAAQVAEAKHLRLLTLLGELRPVVVALSGGVDSTFLFAAAVEARSDAVAAIGVSPSLATHELVDARAIAAQLGADLREVPTHELDDPRYAVNDGRRCFFCKTELYRRLLDATEDLPGRTVVDGTNASDLGDDRPGMRAAAEQGVRSPLLEVGLEKAEIRHLARVRGLPTWDKPEAACLASRLPVGTAVTRGRLGQVESGERLLRELGFRHVRVRHGDNEARIEVDPTDMARVLARRPEIIAGLRDVGYDRVTLDLAGYRRGGGTTGGGKG